MPTTRPDLAIVLDNPMLVRHLRARLRRGQVVPWLSVVLILCLAIGWAGQAFDLFLGGQALGMILGLEVLILAFIGSAQIGGAIAGARESGILDFHRVSPQPPSWLAIGVLLGAPAREYLLFAATAPFALAIAAASPAGVRVLLLLWMALLLTAWLLHATALLMALGVRKPKASNFGGMVGFIVLAFFLIQPIAGGIWYASNLLREGASVSFFGRPLPWLLVFALNAGSVLGIFVLASARRMRSETAHAFAKAEAPACLAVLATLLIGDFWGYEGADALALVLIYALLIVGCILAATVTPTRAEYVRGLHRALRHGRRRPGPWTDEGTNPWAIYLLSGVAFLAATIAWQGIVGRDVGGLSNYGATINVAVFTIAYVGFGLQYLKLRLPSTGSTIMSAFLFTAWVVPLLVGWLVYGTTDDRDLAFTILPLSPLAGIVMSSGLVDEAFARSARLSAIAPAIAFAFLFHHLLVNTRRRLEFSVRSVPGLAPKPSGPFDDLDRQRSIDVSDT